MTARVSSQCILFLLFLVQAIQQLPNTQSLGDRELPLASAEDKTMRYASLGETSPPFGKLVEYINAVPLELARVPSGKFLMGNDLSTNLEETPAHSVSVKSFYIGQYEITREQWNIVVNTLPPANHPLERQPVGTGFEADTPADVVSWDEAIEFCDRLTRFTGRRHRLPSEAEWEYACRSGTRTEYSFGDKFNPNLANMEFASDGILPVGKLGYANAWGLYDMHGNVSEWCLDNEHPNYIGAPTDGSAWVEGGNVARRVKRGGQYRWKPEFGRSSARNFSLRSVRTSGDGFRVVVEASFTVGSGKVSATSAANYQGNMLALESIVALFGSNLSSETQVASSTPLPIALAKASVFIKDSQGNEQACPIFFTSPDQINLQIPAGLAPGPASIYAVNNGNIHSTGSIEVAGVSPGLFSADASGIGLAAAVALRIRASGEQVYEPVGQFDTATNRFIPLPIDLSNSAEEVYLILFGTGFRNRSDLANVSAKIAGAETPVSFAGAQGGLVGVDQCNLRLPHSLAGRGEIGIALTVDGKVSNTVKVRIK
ncbi:MAG TPA: SUMF1/EgtB/PvdO family nonheme iron enzyme [Blastocatellia bacterium]|nr:SUMF1/EgtB/PvdO family nonheme iron enzyme [Blastocatellia bacterium]